MTSIFSVVKKGFILAQSGLSESQAWSALEQAGVQKFVRISLHAHMPCIVSGIPFTNHNG